MVYTIWILKLPIGILLTLWVLKVTFDLIFTKRYYLTLRLHMVYHMGPRVSLCLLKGPRGAEAVGGA